MTRLQLPLFGAQKRERRMCFFSLHPRETEKSRSETAPEAL